MPTGEELQSKVKTLADIVYESVPAFNKSDCLMAKSAGIYANISAQTLVQTVRAVSAYLVDQGVLKGDRIGLLSENRPEWVYADLAILCAGAITVPVYGTLPAKQIEYIMRDSGMETIFVSSLMQLTKILEIAAQFPDLKKIILFDAHDFLPPKVIGFSEVCSRGAGLLQNLSQRLDERRRDLLPEDVATIVYTSGTTGEPKGVMLTNRNILSNVEAIRTAFQFVPEDRALSFLPLSHIFERMGGYYSLLYYGCTIAYAENLEQLSRNLSEVQPTLLISVPRIYEKFYSRITAGVAAEGGIKRKLAQWALETASVYAETRLSGTSPSVWLSMKKSLADTLVLKKIRNRLGGKMRLAISGGAALPKQLGHFFYGLGITILEGYGLTETSPVIAVNRPEAFKFGTVGQPIPGVEIRIAEDGEILTRGPHVMKGYYRKSKETSEAITADGWFRTGDIGEIDADGYLRITDRKKDLIITSAGKNIAPQFVENMLKTSRYVTQIVVVGDKRKFPSALVVPNLDNLRQFAAGHQIPESEYLFSPVILKEIQRDIDCLSQNLAPFEKVKKIVLLEKEFTVESGEMTPSLKIRRNVVERKYKDLIDRLYTEDQAS